MPTLQVRACYFHIVRAIIHYAKDNGLPHIMGDERLARWLKEILGKLNLLVDKYLLRIALSAAIVR
jgi:hypothetical protein